MKLKSHLLIVVLLITNYSLAQISSKQIDKLVDETMETFNVAGVAVVEEKSRDLKHESYPELGMVFSSIMNPTIGYWFGSYGIRVAGMYLKENRNEFHLNLGYKILDNEKKQRSINILLSKIEGYDPGADYDFTSLGVAYSWNTLFGVRGLFAQLGMAKVLHDNLGNVKDEFLVPCGYIGYMYRFTPK
ncbi:hypothetical protein ACFL46_05885 [Candidatus Neomarinimicrobiota bacterium]